MDRYRFFNITNDCFIELEDTELYGENMEIKNG